MKPALSARGGFAPPADRPARANGLLLLVLGSLIGHLLLLALAIRHGGGTTTPMLEIPVEIVAAPPAPPPAAKTETKPQPPKTAPKPTTPKPAETKPETGTQRLKDLLGPMPAIALPAASDSGTEGVAYRQLVLSQVAKAKKQGRYQGLPGAASVTFRLGDGGEVVSTRIVRPSGDAALDAEALAMIARGAPYPAPPPGAEREFTVTLRFESLF